MSKTVIKDAFRDSSGRSTVDRAFIGADFGLEQDYTAFAIVEQGIETSWENHTSGSRRLEVETPHYRLRALERLPLPTSVDAVCKRSVTLMLSQLARMDIERGELTFVGDRTGVGNAILQDVHRELDAAERKAAHGRYTTSSNAEGRGVALSVLPVTITAGHRSRIEEGVGYVPRNELLSVAKGVLGMNRLKVPRSLRLASAFVDELRAFRIDRKLKAAEDVDDIAWRQSEHDDLIFAVAMTLWLGQKHVPRPYDRSLTTRSLGYTPAE